MIAATVRLPRIEPIDCRSVAAQIEHYLVRPNEDYLQACGAAIPALFEAPISYAEDRYLGEPIKEWLTIPWVLACGIGVCKEFSAWLVAEDRLRGIQSLVHVYQSSEPGEFHATVARPLGFPPGPWAPWCAPINQRYYQIDPSLRFGMRDGRVRKR
jgi:hypothetical protein